MPAPAIMWERMRALRDARIRANCRLALYARRDARPGTSPRTALRG